ncbi:MAG TPA: hypothetical protein VG711_04785 [Phycisphaerales bacterium]|nr:hypothetical protein [Phycisphaerales bacterium]
MSDDCRRDALARELQWTGAMISQLSQQTIVIGDATDADELRRKLIEEHMDPVIITDQIRGLRRSLVLGEMQLAVVCVPLTPNTISRFGESLQKLMDDQASFSTAIRTVGMLDEQERTSQAALLECHMYTRGIQEAYEAVLMFREQMRAIWKKCIGSRGIRNEGEQTGRVWERSPGDGLVRAWRVAEMSAGNEYSRRTARRRQRWDAVTDEIRTDSRLIDRDGRGH